MSHRAVAHESLRDDLQGVKMEFDPGETVVAEAGARRLAWAFAGLLALTFLFFSPSLFCGTVFFDDFSYVVNNLHVTEGFSRENFFWVFQEHYGFWSPLLWLSYQVDASLFGPEPFGFHFTNVLLHSLNTGFLFLLLRRMTGSFWKSLAVAVLWGWHPLRVESVTWITERKDVLSAFFMFLALHAYVSFVQKRGVLRMGWVFLFMMAGLMVKPILVTFPFLLLTLDFWPLRRLPSEWKQVAAEKTLLFVGAVLYAGVGWLSHSKAMCSLDQCSIVERMAIALQNFSFYIEKTFCPFGLAAPYPMVEAFWPVAVASFIGLVALTVIFWLVRRRAPWGLAGWLWFGIALAPVCGLVQIGNTTTADRFTYLPAIGLSLAVVWGLAFVRRLPTKEIVIVIAVACALLSVRQIAFWRNSDMFFGRALSVTKDNGVAHALYGAWLVKENRDAEAYFHICRGVEVSPGYLPGSKSLGLFYFKRGDYERAMHYIELAYSQSKDPEQAAIDLAACRKIITEKKNAVLKEGKGDLDAKP